MEHSGKQKKPFKADLLSFFAIFLVSSHDKLRSHTPRPPGEWMRKALALAEMPEIDHRVCQGFQGIVQPADPLET